MKKVILSSILKSKTRTGYAEALAESNLRYDSLVEQIAQGIFTIDKTGLIEFANPAMTSILAFEPNELVGKSVYTLVSNTSKRIFRKLLKSPAEYTSKSYEITMLNKKGKEVQTLVILQLLVDDEGDYAGCFIILTDISDQKRNEQKIIQLNAELAQRIVQLESINTELEAFSYSVSHDLRAPLRHIGGYADLITSRYRDLLPEKGIHFLDTINDSVKQMGTLIDDLLTFSRTGRAEIKLSEYSMDRLVNEVIKLFNDENSNRDIEWKIDPLPDVKSDYSMLKLVWMNLISNSVKFTAPRQHTVIEVGCEQKPNETVCYVKDNGVGFEMKYAHKLFGVFQRMHSSAEFEGTGIGLANVRRIIAKHGGKTWADSDPEQGTTIFFSLPNKGGNGGKAK